ncbi:kinase-like domain-containing protein [Mycena capillaripes]|nr:kinase-like domain-containing protein [Mycena capillaripes]
MSLINVLIHTDIRCICAQFADILCDFAAYEDFLKAESDDAQKLLDLLQDLLDYPLLDGRIRPVILKALLKLSTKSGRHPRCFALSDGLQLADRPAAAGSFGDVWKGSIHGETVSVKIMRVYQETDVEALLKAFHHEALIWRQLSHPNLLPFFGLYYLGDIKCQLCLVSPWMENGDMTRYLKNNPTVNRLSLVLDIALGLDHLHSFKLVHGDLKAINVLVTRSGRAVLADFGLSSVTDSKILSSTSTSKGGGTMRWQAPELFRGSRNSFASDVYAFSCVCYEIFTGNLPFCELPSDVAVMYQVTMHGQRPKRSSGIPDDVWTLMTECWNEVPRERLSAEQIVFRLRDRPIGAVPTDVASDWDPWYTSKFRSSLEEHTLFLSCGNIDDWLKVRTSLAI